ncbi:ribosomal-protein-alanine N-acetyltransferase [Paenibacillus uliginis N3/975]|uniref:Ribosomal-protein-alanine N-acetyltransferase n=1 Tax=Paenibacillus uliginis N3/975 TaxID=1313296 RepID=A0A1X7HHY2_9BACL|nr:GNAT family N-acetyltransferase [Paenibacillus uliginis]SMF86995.1 ribosomal-protein-alanine N-acetyltransferase [Paenibacillus uliginis N3/975]
MDIELHSQRLILKSIDESKAMQVLDYVVRNKEFLERWEVVRNADYYTAQTQKELILSDKLDMEKGQLVKVWMYKIDEPDKIIGSIALSNIVKEAFLSCHLGYRLDQEENNQGYMTEGIKCMINYTFDVLKLHRIEANIMPRNEASLKVVQKLGFYHEGLAQKYLKINGTWEDHIHMVLRNHEME